MVKSKKSRAIKKLCPVCVTRSEECGLSTYPCPFRLDNELALITGGGSGLGLAMAQCMVDAGARVVLTGRRKTVLQEAAARLGPQAVYISHDVTKLKDAP